MLTTPNPHDLTEGTWNAKTLEYFWAMFVSMNFWKSLESFHFWLMLFPKKKSDSNKLGSYSNPTRWPHKHVLKNTKKHHASAGPPSDNAFARKAFDTSETQQPSGTWHQSSRWTTIVYAAAMLCQYGKMEVLNHTSLVSKYVSNQQVVVSVNISRFYQVFQVSKLTTTGEFVTYVTSPELQVITI